MYTNSIYVYVYIYIYIYICICICICIYVYVYAYFKLVSASERGGCAGAGPLLLPVRFPFCWFYTYQNIQRHHIHPSFIHSLKHHRVCVCVCVCVCLPLILNHFYGFHGVRPRIVNRGREYLKIGVNQTTNFQFHLFVLLLSPHVCT